MASLSNEFRFMISPRLVAPVRAERSLKKPRVPVAILIVDDNASKRLAMRAILEPLDYVIVEADSGTAALRCVMEQNFAVILLDVQMPIMDGFETAAHIRQRVQSEMTPIIFVTALSSDELEAPDLYAEGAVDFIFAPIPHNELRAKVAVFANLFVRAEELAAQAREVQTSADQLRLLTDAAPIGIFQTDADKNYVYTNPRWTEITGIQPEDAIGQPCDSIIEAAARVTSISATAGDGASSREITRRYEMTPPDSTPLMVTATARSLPDSEGAVGGWVGTLADVRDASRAEEAEGGKRDAENRYRQIVETTMEGVWVVDADDRTTFVNDAMARMLGVSPAEMQGRRIDDFHDPAGRADAEKSLVRQRDGHSEQRDVVFRRSDGTTMNALLSANPFVDDAGEYSGALTMIRDVTESVAQEERGEKLEEQLRQSQRLEAIGHLAGGIAHDFNNLLLVICGYGEIALRQISRDEKVDSATIRDMLDAAERATQLTRQLLAFGRRQVLRPEVVDIGLAVRQLEKLLRQLIGSHVELEITTPNIPILVEVDRSQLEQIIANLAINARDAMPDGGRIGLSVSLSHGVRGEAMLAISDNGCGMDPETAARVFEPFFSTKGSAGNGFGLATVHGIVSQSGGRISLDSALGVGTTFSIFLPTSDAELPQLATVISADVQGGAGTILVVEDDQTVRTLVVAMLDDLGYQVIEAAGGEEAIAVASAHQAGIDLLLTDLIMPGLSGRETADGVRNVFPGAKVLYMSGYTDDIVVRDGGVIEPGFGFIQKPFGAKDLARRVHEVLDTIAV
jgi:two-component system, cell cycle sensor histidine kinase and response regulator CckA